MAAHFLNRNCPNTASIDQSNHSKTSKESPGKARPWWHVVPMLLTWQPETKLATYPRATLRHLGHLLNPVQIHSSLGHRGCNIQDSIFIILVSIYMSTWFKSTVLVPHGKHQDATHEPECSHAEHFCETNYLNILPLLPYQCVVDCGTWNGVKCKVQSVKVECWMGNAMCSVKCGLWSVKCQVWGVKCEV